MSLSELGLSDSHRETLLDLLDDAVGGAEWEKDAVGEIARGFEQRVSETSPLQVQNDQRPLSADLQIPESGPPLSVARAFARKCESFALDVKDRTKDVSKLAEAADDFGSTARNYADAIDSFLEAGEECLDEEKKNAIAFNTIKNIDMAFDALHLSLSMFSANNAIPEWVRKHNTTTTTTTLGQADTRIQENKPEAMYPRSFPALAPRIETILFASNTPPTLTRNGTQVELYPKRDVSPALEKLSHEYVESLVSHAAVAGAGTNFGLLAARGALGDAIAVSHEPFAFCSGKVAGILEKPKPDFTAALVQRLLDAAECPDATLAVEQAQRELEGDSAKSFIELVFEVDHTALKEALRSTGPNVLLPSWEYPIESMAQNHELVEDVLADGSASVGPRFGEAVALLQDLSGSKQPRAASAYLLAALPRINTLHFGAVEQFVGALSDALFVKQDRVMAFQAPFVLLAEARPCLVHAAGCELYHAQKDRLAPLSISTGNEATDFLLQGPAQRATPRQLLWLSSWYEGRPQDHIDEAVERGKEAKQLAKHSNAALTPTAAFGLQPDVSGGHVSAIWSAQPSAECWKTQSRKLATAAAKAHGDLFMSESFSGALHEIVRGYERMLSC